MKPKGFGAYCTSCTRGISKTFSPPLFKCILARFWRSFTYKRIIVHTGTSLHRRGKKRIGKKEEEKVDVEMARVRKGKKMDYYSHECGVEFARSRNDHYFFILMTRAVYTVCSLSSRVLLDHKNQLIIHFIKSKKLIICRVIA